MDIHSPFTLPSVEFVGGATQELMFHCYHKSNHEPSNLSFCMANFSVVSYVNKYSSPILSKTMTIQAGTEADGRIYNVLTVVLNPEDTKELRGKYIYQITIRDVANLAEIPGQGLLHITNNINKDYIS